MHLLGISFRIKMVPSSNLAPVKYCPKGAGNAKLDYIISIGHLLANFRKNSLFLVALNLDPKCALNFK